MKKINYQLIRDKPKIEKILDLILSNDNPDNIRTTRIDKFSIRIYFQLDNENIIYFNVFNPSQNGLNELQKNEKEKQNEIEF